MMNTLLNLLFSTGRRRFIEGWLYWPIRLYTAGFTLWVLYAAIYSRIDALSLVVIFLSLIFVPSFLLIGATENAHETRPAVADWIWSALAAACAVYFIANIPETAMRISLFDDLRPDQFIMAGLLILLTLEITRRTVGVFLTLLVISFILYNLLGHLIPGQLGHGLITLGHFIDINVYTTDGLFGVPLKVAATYAFLFVMFGTFLEKAGGSEFFFRLATAASGRSVGGPAKIAVSSSALFGTMSGSPTSDVVATGSITIPMMKRLGYKPEFAGGVEVAASTGGSLLPPVMGSAAFIMAEITGISYGEIVLAAIVPAVLYYVGIFIQVHLRSVSLNLAAMDTSAVPGLAQTMREGWQFLLPLAGLVMLLVMGYSPTMVAAFSALGVWAVSFLRADTRLGVRKTIEALSDTAIRMLAVTGACAAAGLVIGGITMTGLASKFSFVAFSLAGDSVLLALVLCALVTIILGLGMPTPSAYVLAAVLVGPTLVNEYGFPELNSHLFLLYFAVLSAMTPPVAVAAYAAAAIAMANPLRIAVIAMRFSIVAFVVPFMFVINPLVLTPFASLQAFAVCMATVLACALVATASELRWTGASSTAARWTMALCALLLTIPDPLAKAVGAALGVAVLFYGARMYRESLATSRRNSACGPNRGCYYR
ncbi:TRAP transporter fused permease subunit [Roseovarius sp. MBR-6]|uniref:TRAP transporter permease n=1 Tax=Roseovarius sp. MBR-6 TaxID=3156459 RepID=UPI0033952D4A